MERSSVPLASAIDLGTILWRRGDGEQARMRLNEGITILEASGPSTRDDLNAARTLLAEIDAESFMNQEAKSK